ncbi:MAG: inorganic pyrophosphatase Ppa [Pseudomonadota bacterium]
MKTTYFLAQAKKLELVKYQKTTDRIQLKKTHIAFSGSLRQHPYDSDKVVLLCEPYSQNTIFYEFKNDDIDCAEKLPNIVNSRGEDVTMIMLWVKKGCVAIRSSVFIVDDSD